MNKITTRLFKTNSEKTVSGSLCVFASGTEMGKRWFSTLCLVIVFVAFGTTGMAQTAAPSDVRLASNAASGDLINTGGKDYEVFYLHPNNTASTTTLAVKTYNGTTTTVGPTTWCNIGSSVGNTSASTTAGSQGEYTLTTSTRWARVRASNQANYQVVFQVEGYAGVSAFYLSTGTLFSIKQWDGSAYTIVPADQGTQSAAGSYFIRRAVLDKTKRYQITLLGPGSGTTNYDAKAFALELPSGPVISTTGTLSAVNTTYGTASVSPTSFNVSGANMTAGISVNPPAGFQVSTTSNFSSNVGTNGSPITVGAAGTIASTPVYVRLLATATVAGSPYSGNIVLSSSGATSVNKATASSSVSAKGLTITGLTGNNKLYDGTTSASFSGTPEYSGLVNGDSFSVTGTPSATFTTPNAADNKSITVTGFTAPSTNYTVTQPSLTGNITKVGLTITAGNQTVTYGTAASAVTTAGTYTPSGFVNSENSSVISGAASYTTSYTDTTPAATSGVTITPAVGTLTATNYNFTSFVDGTITITKANSTISITGGSPTYAYDGNPQGPTTSSVTGSTGTVSYLYTNTSGPAYSSSTPPSNAGAYQVVATVDTDTNYNGASSAPYAFSIVSATMPEITSALTASATYGVAATTYTITGTFSPTSFDAIGLPAGLSVNTSTGEITGTPTAAPGAYNVTISATNGTGTGDDILVYTIVAKELTVSGATADNKEYDRTNAATFSGTLNGVVTGDEALVSLNGTGTFAQITVGTAIAVTSTATLGGTKAAYYTLTQPTGLSADITPKGLTVTGAVVTPKSYTGTDAATITGASLSGVISPDVVTLVNGGGTFASVNVASGIAVTSAFSLTGADNGNYSLAQPSLTGNITQASLTITGLTGDNKPYDGNTSASFSGTPAYSGLQNGETFAVTGSPVASFATATAADGKIITITGYSAPSANYTVTAPTVTGNITKVALTITANNQSVGYGTAASVVTAAGTFTATGFVNSETASVITGSASYTTNYTNSTAVGASGVTITPAAGSLAATNYSFGTFVDGTITVTLGTQTITLASTATKAAGFADYSPATSATSGINPITYTSSNPAVATVVNGGTQIHYIGLGTTTITASQAASDNYSAATDKVQTLTVAKPKVLYATYNKASVNGTGASAYNNEAIIRMLTAENFDVTVIATDANGAGLPASYTTPIAYDLIVVQESIGGGDNVLKPTGRLGIKNLTVPVIYNKSFAFNGNRAVTTTAAATDSGSLLSVDVTGNTSDPLYSGITISGNSIPLLKTTSDDTASTTVSTKGITVVNGLLLSNTTTLKATLASVTDATKAIVINDIPAGTQFGTTSTDVCPSRMIAFGLNYGAICEAGGKNVTNEFLTVWRNAAYILTGQTVPTSLYINPDNQQSITFTALPTKKVGDSSFALTATSAQTPNSGNPITYTSSNNTTVASVAGNTVTILGRGTTTITASQAAGGATATTAYWYAAPSVQQNLVVNAAAPVITGSYCVGDTTVSGTSTEPDGTDIIVYKAGNIQIGATTVIGGVWSATVPALESGDSLTATAQEGLLYVSAPSAAKVVNALPVVTASNVSGCPNTDIALIGSPVGGTFSITNPYNGTENTTYTYTYTDGNGCTNTSSPATVTLGVEINFNDIDDNCDGSKFEGHAPVVVDVITASGPLATMTATITSSTATNTSPYSGASVTYKFKVTKTNAPTSVAYVSSNTTSFAFSSASNAAHSSTYDVQATAIVNGEEQPYSGNTRTFTTPAAPTIPNPPTQTGPVGGPACAYTLARIDSYIYANNSVTYGANRYEFLVERMNGAVVEQTLSVTTTVPYFRLTSIVGIPATMQVLYGTTYRIKVRYGYAGAVSYGSQIYTAYGSECLVSTPAMPLSSIACGTTLASMDAYVYTSGNLGGANLFEFKVARVSPVHPGELPITVTEETLFGRTVPYFRLSMLSQLLVGLEKEYSVSVRYRFNSYGVQQYSDWSTPCALYTPDFRGTQVIESQCDVSGVPSSTSQYVYADGVGGSPVYRFRLFNNTDFPYTEESPYDYSVYSPNNYIKLNQFPGLVSGIAYTVTVVAQQYGEYPDIALAKDCSITAPQSTPVGPAKVVVAAPFQATAYPNPFANNFMLAVKSGSQSAVDLKVYDMIGRLIESRKVTLSDMETTTIGGQYPSGVYNVVVSQDDETQTIRVVKR